MSGEGERERDFGLVISNQRLDSYCRNCFCLELLSNQSFLELVNFRLIKELIERQVFSLIGSIWDFLLVICFGWIIRTILELQCHSDMVANR